MSVASRAGDSPVERMKIGGVFRRREVEASADDSEGFGWTDDEVLAHCRAQLGPLDSVYYHPAIPASKLKNATEVHRASLGGAQVLVLYDDTVFGAADDGFVVTAEGLCWKNIMEDPQTLRWDEIEPDEVAWDDDGVTLMGAKLSITNGDNEQIIPRVGQCIRSLAELCLDDE